MNTQELKKFIAACDIAGHAPLIDGVHGIGKSETIKQYAKENDMHCEILMLSLLDTADLCGIPRSAEIGGLHSTIWSAPIWVNRIIDAAWPLNLDVDALQFNDPEFEKFVQSELNRS